MAMAKHNMEMQMSQVTHLLVEANTEHSSTRMTVCSHILYSVWVRRKTVNRILTGKFYLYIFTHTRVRFKLRMYVAFG
jgi:hypothetical protein